MSIKAVAWVLDESPATGTDLLVLIALADFADENGCCWPSVIRLAHRARVSERTARRCLRTLESIGQIVTDISGNGRSSSRYRLTFAAPLGFSTGAVKLTPGQSDTPDTGVRSGGTQPCPPNGHRTTKNPPTPRTAGGSETCKTHKRRRRGCAACDTANRPTPTPLRPADACPTHPGQPANNCGGCRSDQLAKETA